MGKPQFDCSWMFAPLSALLGLAILFFAALVASLLLAASALAMALGQLGAAIGQSLAALFWPLHVLLAVLVILESIEPAWEAVSGTAGILGRALWLIVTRGQPGGSC